MAATLLFSAAAAPTSAAPSDGAGPPPFDVSRVPQHVLDDETVEVTSVGLLIDEPEPFAGWPTALIDQVIAAEKAADAELPEPTNAPTASEALTLHSLPGANLTIFLDFDGHTTTGTEWNGRDGRPDTFTSSPYSRDGNDAFNQTELQYIGEIWEHVAEDFAPFNVDITTEEPAFDQLWRSGYSDPEYGTRVVISPTQDWYGSSGGVAYVGSFSWANERSPAPDYNPVVTPAYVFSDALGGGWPKYVAEAASHEAGHTLGLSHDGLGSKNYYSGHDVEGGGGWAPIMGVGYSQEVTQWSAGTYPGATQTQDDLAILATRLGWLSAGSSTAGLPTLTDGNALVGTVEQSTTSVDIDIDVPAGQTSIAVTPAVPDSNLLVQARLLSGNTVMTTATPATAVGWQLDFDETLPAGIYTVRLTSIGWGDVEPDDLDGFPSYGSIGQFQISLDVVPDDSVVTTTTTTSPTTTTTTSTTSTTTTTTSTTTTVPPNDPMTTSGPAGCRPASRGGWIGFSEQQAADTCFATATRLG